MPLKQISICVADITIFRRCAQRSVRLARSKNERAGAWRLGCARVRPTFCTQLDWAFSGIKLSGQLQARCLVHPLPSPGHGAHDAFSQIRFWKIPKKWLICTFFGETKKTKISDPWGSRWKLSYQRLTKTHINSERAYCWSASLNIEMFLFRRQRNILSDAAGSDDVLAVAEAATDLPNDVAARYIMTAQRPRPGLETF